MLLLQTRNPLDMIWSYYQLLYTLEHADYLTADRFDITGWRYFGPHIAHMMSQEFQRIILPAMRSYPPEDVVLVRFEDLKAATAPSLGEDGIRRGVRRASSCYCFITPSPTKQYSALARPCMLWGYLFMRCTFY